MRQEKSTKKLIRQIAESRAARICAAAVSVFLCAFTLLEFTALEMEWEIPVLETISGENTFWMLDYRIEEVALEDSAENVLLEESEEPENPAESEKIEESEEPPGTAETEESEELPGTAETEESEEPEKPPGTAEAEETENTEETEMPEENEFPYYIRVNRKQNCITVYTLDENGGYTVPYKAMICSTGLYNATPRGTFQLSAKYLWRELYGGVYGQYATRIHGGVLFHSVPYYRKSKNSLCTDKYNKLGQQASMGCIRLTVEDAKWIAENCPAGTTVEIYEDEDPGPLGKPEAVKIDMDNPNKGWDPTDPDADNPWNQITDDK